MKRQAIVTYATVPRLWPGETIVCLGSGPSLTKADVAFVRGKARVIAVNDNYKLAPWAEVLYACDGRWWTAHRGVPSFPGLKYGMTVSVAWPDVQRLKPTGMEGLELDPSGLKTGKNSGYQAINLARHLGAARIVLLGYDLQQTPTKAHWFGDHPRGLSRTTDAQFVTWRKTFATLVGPLQAQGISIVNASRETALRCFPRVALQDAFPQAVAA